MERTVMILLWAAICSSIVAGCLLLNMVAQRRQRNSWGWRWLGQTIWPLCVTLWSVWVVLGLPPPVLERNIALKIVWKILPLAGGTMLFLVLRWLMRQREVGT